MAGGVRGLALVLMLAGAPAAGWDWQPPPGSRVIDLTVVTRLPGPVALVALAGLRQAVIDADPAEDLSALDYGSVFLDASLFDTGRDLQVAALRRLAVDLTRHRFGDDSPEMARALAGLAGNYGFYPRDPAATEAPARAALEMARRHAASLQANELTGFLEHMAYIDLALGRPAEAAALWQEVVDHWRGVLEPGHIALEPRLRALAEALIAAGDPAAAEPHLREALAILHHRDGAETTRQVGLLVDLARVLDDLGRPAEARVEWAAAARLAELALGQSWRWIGPEDQVLRLGELARMHMGAGSPGDAVAALVRAAEVPGSADDPDLAGIIRAMRAALAEGHPGRAALDAAWPER
jgi:hypothetical protein